jgi:prepilin peptidase CpaA
LLELAVLTFFPGLLIIAALGDLVTYRIPNWLSVALIVLFGATAVGDGLEWMVVGAHAILALLLLLVGMGLFALRLLGGGDAKLLAATGLWMGWAALPAYLIWVTVTGGLLAAMVLTFRKIPMSEGFAAPKWVSRLHDPREGIPYGIAIASGALIALPSSIWFEKISSPF